jgi:hypothetical protein
MLKKKIFYSLEKHYRLSRLERKLKINDDKYLKAWMRSWEAQMAFQKIT